jgi:hypothetical protein
MYVFYVEDWEKQKLPGSSLEHLTGGMMRRGHWCVTNLDFCYFCHYGMAPFCPCGSRSLYLERNVVRYRLFGVSLF